MRANYGGNRAPVNQPGSQMNNISYADMEQKFWEFWNNSENRRQDPQQHMMGLLQNGKIDPNFFNWLMQQSKAAASMLGKPPAGWKPW